MRIIMRKQKDKIGKQLSAIYFIATESMGETKREIKIENMAKIISNVADLAFEIGGEKFATIEVPGYVKFLQDNRDINRKEEEPCSATTSVSAPKKNVPVRPANAIRRT